MDPLGIDKAKPRSSPLAHDGERRASGEAALSHIKPSRTAFPARYLAPLSFTLSQTSLRRASLDAAHFPAGRPRGSFQSTLVPRRWSTRSARNPASARTYDPEPKMSDAGAILRDQVLALAGVERAIEEALDRQSDLTLPHPELHASLRAVQAQSGAQRRDLETYLRKAGVDPAVPPSPISPLLAEACSSGELTRVLSADYAAFSFAASESSLLTQLSLRLYDPVLRELAPRHLSCYARAVRLLSHLLPSVVVEELNRQGLQCRCICPICSIGACGCTAAGRAWISQAWQEARPQADEQAGLALTPPRQGSQLADIGVRGGDRLVEVDGQPLTSSGFAAAVDLITAIRQHEIGDEVTLRVSRGSEPPRTIRVRHVSDYPSG